MLMTEFNFSKVTGFRSATLLRMNLIIGFFSRVLSASAEEQYYRAAFCRTAIFEKYFPMIASFK